MLWKWLLYLPFLNLSPVFSQDASLEDLTSGFMPCDEGWFHFGQKCYRLRGRSDRKSWYEAARQCELDGGHLVSVHSREELDFLVLFLLLVAKTAVWIGLNDQLMESEYAWHDGSPVNFTEWMPNEPSGHIRTDEDCAEMLFYFYRKHMEVIGKWNDLPCTQRLPYICQKKAEPQRLSPDPQFCSSNEGGGWKFQKSCYHVLRERQTWDEAEQHCKKNYNGHLVTVLDTMVDRFLDRVLASFDESIWIGLKIRNQFQQKWSSGWHVSYDTGLSKPNRKTEDGLCVLRRGRKWWTRALCSEAHSFVCETSKAVLPVLKPAVPGSHCPTNFGEWRDLDGESCYFIETEKEVGWHEAKFECDNKGGSLVSIHSQAENDVLHQFVKYTQRGIYIGLIRTASNRKTFRWIDGTPLTFMRWDVGQPDDRDAKEACGEVWVPDMKWNDCGCNLGKGYMCSVKKIPPQASLNTSIIESTGHQLSSGAAIGMAASIILALTVLGAVIYVTVRQKRIPHKRFSSQSISEFKPRNASNFYEPSEPNQEILIRF